MHLEQLILHQEIRDAYVTYVCIFYRSYHFNYIFCHFRIIYYFNYIGNAVISILQSENKCVRVREKKKKYCIVSFKLIPEAFRKTL